MRKTTLFSVALLLIGGGYFQALGRSDSGLYDAMNAGSATELEAQQPRTPKQVVGAVKDAATGDPVAGCSVTIKGTYTGVQTDIYGQFKIEAAEGDVLEFAFIGYQTASVVVGKQTTITVSLQEDSLQVDEVVVTAFGSGQRKESVTGAIQSVNPDALMMPSANLSNSFAGRLSGVIARQTSGEPGSNGSDFYIRGVSTISGVTKPLIIMDGVEISSGDLNSIDPEIIESFSILKDATATAMYGTRGANGVMIIKTKSGSDLDRPAIGIRVESYVNMPTKIQKFVDGPTYMQMYNEAINTEGLAAIPFTADEIANTRLGVNPYIFPNVDWYKEIFNDITYNQKANFNIRGGTSKITYFMNLAFNHETGMLKNNGKKYYSYNNNIDLMKYAFQNNIDFNLSKTSKIALHLNVQLSDYTGPFNAVNNIFGAIMNNNPVDFPIEYPDRDDGDWTHWGIMQGGNTAGAVNPMAQATNGYNDTFESTVIANIDFDQKLDFITKGLSFKALFSFKNWSQSARSRYQNHTNIYTIREKGLDDNGDWYYLLSSSGTPAKPVLTTTSSSTGDRRYYFQAYLNYDRAFGDHYLNGMLLFNTNAYNLNYPVATTNNTLLVNSLPQRKMGVAMRLMYDYRHKYMIEFNAGYNGSENFAKGHRWGFFPSVSLGWNISQEPFWNPIRDVVSNLKLRGSYGLVGNDQVNDIRYIYMEQVNLSGSPSYKTGYGNNTEERSGVSFSRFRNDEITWEVGYKLNVGLDMQFFHSLDLTVEGFREMRKNIFQARQSVPNYLGTSNTTIYGNFAEVKSWGVEVSADYNKQINRDLMVSFKGTFTFARNRITKYDEGAGVRPGMRMTGRSTSALMGYVADGLYIDEGDIANSPTSTIGNIAIAPGDIKYLDQPDADGIYDGRITSDDRIEMGYPNVPEIIYGFGPSITYKNWDFSFFFQGAAHTSFFMSGFAPFGTQYNRNVLTWIADDYWSVDNQNPNAAYPRLTKRDNNNNTAASSFWLRNGAFLKLKNIEIGYTYKRARIYVSAANVCTISKFKLWDPEMGGGAGLTYPTQRTFNIGVQVKL